MDQQAILDWLINGRVGLSSKTMAAIALGVTPDEVNHPHDPDDFNRCLKLVRAAPQVREAFPKIAALSPVWAALIDKWDAIESRFLEEAGFDWCKQRKAERTYYFMREIIEDAENSASA